MEGTGQERLTGGIIRKQSQRFESILTLTFDPRDEEKEKLLGLAAGHVLHFVGSSGSGRSGQRPGTANEPTRCVSVESEVAFGFR